MIPPLFLENIMIEAGADSYDKRSEDEIIEYYTSQKGTEMIWSKEETLPREEIERIQLERLQETVSRVYEKVAPYRKKMDEAGVKPEDIRTLADLSKLPFVTKQDMRDNYPFGLFAVGKDELVRIHASSGTTGKPTVVGYTQKEL